MPLKAVILGSGYAGQGHAMALRDCGVEIVGMASRTPEVVQRVAAEMGIPHAGTDWRLMLEDLRPDLVAIATPGGTHEEMASACIDAGCHIYIDKPLATTAAGARRLWEKARDAGVKTAYAASYRYQPAASLAMELIAAGAIGTVREAECIAHYGWPALMPFGWPHRLDQGGGRLNNNFTHKLSIVLRAIGGSVPDATVLRATGETRHDLKRVPVGEAVHDFRQYIPGAMTPEQAAESEWLDVDADWGYTVLARIGTPGSDPRDGITALFKHNAMTTSRQEDYVAFYGDGGTIYISGAYAQGALQLRQPGKEWQTIPTPEHIAAALPPIEDNTQRNWTILAKEWIDDIEGHGNAGYLTFRDGWLFQEVIDATRAADGWKDIPYNEA